MARADPLAGRGNPFLNAAYVFPQTLAFMMVLWRRLRGWEQAIDGQLLLFFVLLCNVKLAVKAGALLLLLWRHRALLPQLLRRPPLLPLFYAALALLGLSSALLNGRFAEAHYGWAFAGSELIWAACGLLSLGLWAEARRTHPARVEATFEAFLWANALVSFGQLARIVLETGALNPYRYQGNYQKYFINTGDYIKGFSFDTSTTNAVLCAVGILYFAQKRHWPVVAVCLAALVCTASNLVNALVLAGLLVLFCFRSNRARKSVLALCTLPFVLFWARISPQNTGYMEAVLGMGKATNAAPAAAAAPSAEEQREAFARRWIDSVGARKEPAATVSITAVERPELPQDNIHSAPFQHRDDSGARHQAWVQAAVQIGAAPVRQQGGTPGKLLAAQQTIRWLREHPSRIITGAAPAAFSSKMAFKAAGLHIAGQFPATYRSADFEKGHLALFLSYFTATEHLHSVVHSPNSVYDQLLSEYGLPGLLLLGGYFGYLLRRHRRLRYTLPLVGLLAALLATDYWFEQLSIVPLFELLFFLELQKPLPDARA